MCVCVCVCVLQRTVCTRTSWTVPMMRQISQWRKLLMESFNHPFLLQSMFPLLLFFCDIIVFIFLDVFSVKCKKNVFALLITVILFMECHIYQLIIG